jgi:hypothetical protein
MPSAEQSLGYESIQLSPTVVKKLANIPKNADGSTIACVAHIQCAKLVDAAGYGNIAFRWTNDGVTVPVKDGAGYEQNPTDFPLNICTSLEQIQFIGSAANSRVNVWYSPQPQAINQVPTR